MKIVYFARKLHLFFTILLTKAIYQKKINYKPIIYSLKNVRCNYRIKKKQKEQIYDYYFFKSKTDVQVPYKGGMR